MKALRMKLAKLGTGEGWQWLFLLSGICGSYLVLRSIDGVTGIQGEAAAVLLVFVSAVIFIFESVIKIHWPLYIGMTGVILCLPVIGVRWGTDTIFFVMIFQFSFWMHRNPKKTSGSLPIARFNRFSMIWLILFFFIAAAFAHWNTDGFYQAVYQAEGFVRRNIKRAAGTSDDFSDGMINRGNIYPADIEQMELRVNQEPSEAIYLKDFSGGAYTDGKWERADEGIVFRRMNENTLHWSQWTSWISNMYGSMYVVMNRNMKDHTESEGRELIVQYKNEAADAEYLTYFGIQSRASRNSEDDEDLRDTENSENTKEYRLIYFEQDEMNIDWDNVDEHFEVIRDWYHMIQEAYVKEAYDIYTEVPEKEIARIVKLCESYPMEELDQITDFICSYLKENIAYTQTPGMIPLNVDAAEYFLFEKKEGYCQHFASAAVLMYRLYGIPARYAAGYRVSPSEFVYQEDGNWHAAVTDRLAHAWPEIFIEDYGWVPIEVTPAAESEAGLPEGIDRQQDDRSGQTAVDNESAESSDWHADSVKKPESQVEDNAESNRESQFMTDTAEAVVRSMAIFTAIAVSGLILWNRRLKKEWMRRGGCRRIYRQMICAIHSRGYLKEYDGSEKEFPVKLSEAFPNISCEEAERLARDVNEEVFGRGNEVRAENVFFAETIYDRICCNSHRSAE